MHRIVTLTLSPALDSATRIAHLLPDRKLRCSEPSYAPGGGGINVARAIRNLGGQALAVFPAGGPTGTHLTDLLVAEGVDCRPIPIQAWTRQCFNVEELAHAQQYRFVLPGASLSPSEQAAVLNVIATLQPFEYLVISGSLPEGLAGDFIPRLLAIAHDKGARSVLDTSGAALEQAVEAGGLFLIKPSLSELGHLVGEEITQPDQLVRVTGNLIRAGKCETLMVSMGAQGALLATRDRVERIHAPNVKKISTVGAGDSLLGAMLLKLTQGTSASEAARYGVAAGSASIMSSGTTLCAKDDTEQLFAWMQQNHAPLPV